MRRQLPELVFFLTTALAYFVFLSVKAQQRPVVFEMRYLPGLKYTATVNTATNMQIVFKNDSAQSGKTQAAPMENTVILQNKNSLGYTVTTGDLDAKKNFLVSVKYTLVNDKRLVNGKELVEVGPNLAGQQINGFCAAADGAINIDTSVYAQMNDTLKMKVIGLNNFIRNKIVFPAKGLKTGDTFAQDIPMDIPVSGTPIPVNTHFSYKLTAVRNNMALFDLTEKIEFKAKIAKGDIKISGSGYGSIFFDIGNQFLKVYQTNVVLDYKLVGQGNSMSGSVKIFTDYQVKIEKLTPYQPVK